MSHMHSAVSDLSCYIPMCLQKVEGGRESVGRRSLTTAILANLLLPYTIGYMKAEISLACHSIPRTQNGICEKGEGGWKCDLLSMQRYTRGAWSGNGGSVS